MESLAAVPTAWGVGWAGLIGLVVGSFLNVVILRLPKRLEHDWRCQCRELLELEAENDPRPPGIVWGHSHCPDCGRVIRAAENIPLLSWMVLRGRCAGCGSRISIRYPVIELLTAIAFIGTAIQFGPTLQTLAALTLTGILIALAGIDIDHHFRIDRAKRDLGYTPLVDTEEGLRRMAVAAREYYDSL